MPHTRSTTERIYVDLEYCYPGMTRENGRPSENDLRQIVQIAALRINTRTGDELSSLNTLVRPVFEKELPLFFVELTNITDELVQTQGVPFPEAWQKFVQFCDTTPIWTFHNDWYVLKQNCGYVNIPYNLPPFIQVRDLLPRWGVDPSQYSSGTLHRAAGIEMHGHVHNALHDVRSMAAAVHYFEKGVHE